MPDPKLPEGWRVDFSVLPESKKASVDVDYRGKKASVKLDDQIFCDPNVPEGCKVVMINHEIGHLIYGSNEGLCDEFAFWHSLRAGVSPFLCYLTIRHFMPEHYSWRVVKMGENLLKYSKLKGDYE